MLRIKRLALQNVIFFKRAAFNFCAHPLTFVTGRNLNAGGSTNAAGKSLFFSQIHDLIFGIPIVGSRRDRIDHGKVALFFSFTHDGKEVDYRVVRTIEKRREKLAVYSKQDDQWVDHGYREVAEARKFLLNVLGFTLEEFHTRVYIDGRIPHVLVTGDTSSRKAFFTHFFRLDSQSNMRGLVAAQLKATEAAQTECSVYVKRREELKGSLVGEVIDHEVAVAALKDKLVRVKQRMEKASKLQELVNTYEAAKAGVEFSLVACKNDLSKFDMVLQQRSARLKELARSIEEAEETFNEHVAYSNAQVKRRALKEKLDVLLEEKGEGDIAALAERVERTRLKVSEWKDAKARAAKDLSEIESIPKICSKCGQPWPTLDRANQRLRAKALLGKVEEATQALETLTTRLTSAEAKLSKLRATENRIEALREELTELKAIKKPEKPGGRQELNELLERKMALTNLVNVMKSVQPNIDAVRSYLSMSAEDKALLAKAPKLMAAYETITTQIAECKQLLSEQKRIREELENVRAKIAELKTIQEDGPALRLLQEVFSKKGGLQKALINSICERLEEQVNKYAPLLFAENYRFSFSLDSQFDILVHRQVGKQELVSDVRKLSGAESRLFNLLLLVGLTAFVPSSRRCNLLILDEPDANMGPETIESMMNFLPILNSVIPNIVFITPQAHILDLANQTQLKAQLLTVVKKGRVSSLVTDKGRGS